MKSLELIGSTTLVTPAVASIKASERVPALQNRVKSNIAQGYELCICWKCRENNTSCPRLTVLCVCYNSGAVVYTAEISRKLMASSALVTPSMTSAEASVGVPALRDWSTCATSVAVSDSCLKRSGTALNTRHSKLNYCFCVHIDNVHNEGWAISLEARRPCSPRLAMTWSSRKACSDVPTLRSAVVTSGPKLAVGACNMVCC